MPARWQHQSLMSKKASMLMTSSVFCTSPCTLIEPPAPPGAAALPNTPPKAPNATAREMLLQASATLKITLLKSPLASGYRRRSSIRNWVKVVCCSVSGMMAPIDFIGYYLCAQGARAQLSYDGPIALVAVGSANDGAAGHKGIGARLAYSRNIVGLDAAVHFQPALWGGFFLVGVDALAHRLDLVERGRNEFLSTKTRINAHQQHHIELVHHMVKPAHRCSGNEDQARPTSVFPNQGRGAGGGA